METAYQTKVPADMPEGLPKATPAAPASPADAPVAAKEAPADDAPAAVVERGAIEVAANSYPLRKPLREISNQG